MTANTVAELKDRNDLNKRQMAGNVGHSDATGGVGVVMLLCSCSLLTCLLYESSVAVDVVVCLMSSSRACIAESSAPERSMKKNTFGTRLSPLRLS